MAQPVSFTIPVHSNWVPTYLESILDKRISRTALTYLETFVDILCRCIYLPYNLLLSRKLERVHLFSDQRAQLIDCTARGIASIEVARTVNLLDGTEIERVDMIVLNGKHVHFGENIDAIMEFSRKSHTDYVVVQDLGDQKVEIIEQETRRHAHQNPAVKRWSVDLTKHSDVNVQLGCILQKVSEVYLVENPIESPESA